ncbi:MAG: Gfo/Idh/MocA family oxidoreductase [Sphaerochaeta sp.]|nr:Gfo/Idh/MocA family oxidoreductase [Sphaerochaeta sp.]
MKKIRIGMLSFEHMHAMSYAAELCKDPQVQLVGIADTDEYRGSAMAAQFHTTYYADHHQLLQQQLDGVIVCSNNSLHAGLSCDALRSGAHVLVEKPFATTIEEAVAMIETAKQQNVRIMNAFPMRFNPNVVRAKEILDSGAIGDILCITGINHGKIPGGWFIDPTLAGGGAVMDHTVHIADLLRWLTASEHTHVYCESGDLLHNRNIDDTGLIMVEMENGVFASIDCSWAHHTNYPIWAQVDMHIIGTQGSLELKAFSQVVHLDDQTNGMFEDIGWNETGDEGLVREFLEVCRTGREPSVTGEDGLRSLEVALCAYRSSASHQKEAIGS